jgi:glycosyltransferase involved in cell wall biosynthesis
LQQPPQIKPLDPTIQRPSWSVMIPAYNCSDILPDTIQSVLVQDPSEEVMQIEVVDDASTDANVEELVQEIGKGRVSYYRQPQNVGSLKNFETCLNRAKGHFVHLLHGDDRVKKGYYEKMNELFNRHPEAGAAFCCFEYINEKGETVWKPEPEQSEEGVLDNWLIKIAERQRLQYCTISVKREVYEKIGGYYGVTYGEDWEMWVRIAAHYPVAYTPQALAEYRMHQNTISFNALKTAKNVRDMQWVIDTVQPLLPANERARVRKVASKHYATYAIAMAENIWRQTRDKQVTKLQIKAALKMHTDVSMFPRIAKIYARMLMGY